MLWENLLINILYKLITQNETERGLIAVYSLLKFLETVNNIFPQIPGIGFIDR
jgi:hypothetical protein